MAYSKDNLVPDGRSFLDGAEKVWVYRSADAITTVRAAGYISNAKKMGMKVGDPVTVTDTTNSLTYDTYVVALDATTGAADLADGVLRPITNT